jgi:hypothetical protein
MWFAVQQTPNHSTGTGGLAAMIFIDNKYTRWYYAIVERAQRRASTRKQANELLGYSERHHIIPESFFTNRQRTGTAGWVAGNPNDSNNLVFLTAREHFFCHLLLTKMCEDGIASKKMIFAFWMILASKKQKYVNSRWYAVLRECQAIQIGNTNRGKFCSEETRAKRSKSLKGIKKSEEWLRKIGEAQKGVPKSDSHRAALSGPKSEAHKAALKLAAKTRKPHTAESNLKRAQKLKNKKRPTLTCPHCGKLGGVGNMGRWHFDNCKNQ